MSTHELGYSELKAGFVSDTTKPFLQRLRGTLLASTLNERPHFQLIRRVTKLIGKLVSKNIGQDLLMELNDSACRVFVYIFRDTKRQIRYNIHRPNSCPMSQPTPKAFMSRLIKK